MQADSAVLVATADAPTADTADVVDSVHRAVRAATRTDDHHCRTAWVLVTVRGTPLGVIPRAPLPLDRDDVTRRVREMSPGPRPRTSPVLTCRAPLSSATVVVATAVRRPGGLRACLESIAQLDHDDHDVVVVDNRPEAPAADALPDLVAGLPRVRVVREARPGVGAARNAGLAAATGRVVAFTDDDVRVDRGWLTALVQRLDSSPEVHAATGLVVPSELVTPAQQRYELHYGGAGAPRVLEAHDVRLRAGAGKWIDPRLRVRTPRGGAGVSSLTAYGVGAYGSGSSMAFRRDVLVALGGFDPALGTGTPSCGGEDLRVLVQVLYRGGTVAYEPRAVAHHRHRRSDRALREQVRGGGVGFTAMITSLVLQDPRHLLALGCTAPTAGLRKLAGARAATAAPPPADDDGAELHELARVEAEGLRAGPGAYLRSRRAARTAVGADAVESVTVATAAARGQEERR
ncbi:glycosyltransferase family 2 protein [Kineococcus terrestris]|uniref:glycosyltransferase family 2 protein n=1 Tax=Kineococcus terrestris TaxID=2044856 RepID=UPI0034DB0635